MFWAIVIGAVILCIAIPLVFHHTIEGVARSRMPSHIKALIIGGLCLAVFILYFMV